MEQKEDIQKILHEMMTRVVDHPDDLKVFIRNGEQTTVFEVVANRKDFGKLIGRQGSMASAFRTYLNTLAARHGFRCILDINDGNASRARQ